GGLLARLLGGGLLRRRRLRLRRGLLGLLGSLLSSLLHRGHHFPSFGKLGLARGYHNPLGSGSPPAPRPRFGIAGGFRGALRVGERPTRAAWCAIAHRSTTAAMRHMPGVA